MGTSEEARKWNGRIGWGRKAMWELIWYHAFELLIQYSHVVLIWSLLLVIKLFVIPILLGQKVHMNDLSFSISSFLGYEPNQHCRWTIGRPRFTSLRLKVVDLSMEKSMQMQQVREKRRREKKERDWGWWRWRRMGRSRDGTRGRMWIWLSCRCE